MVAVLAAGSPIPEALDISSELDSRIVLEGVSWSLYKAIDEARGERPKPRFYYLEGVLEIVNTSRRHENVKKTIARLVEIYADAMDIEIEGTGSFTLEREESKRAAEADESYFVGPGSEAREMPDLAIEVVLTSGGINKLEIYKKLGVEEVWLYSPRTNKLAIHRLAGGADQQQPKSKFFPNLDLDLLAACVALGDQKRAVRAFREALKIQPPS